MKTQETKAQELNQRFKALIPALSAEEYAGLEASILAEGCRDSIKIWRDIIVDGHNRYEICQKHGIPFKLTQLRFGTKKDAILWILENQLGRRNLSTAMQIKLALVKAKMQANEVKQQRKATRQLRKEEKQRRDAGLYNSHSSDIDAAVAADSSIAADASVATDAATATIAESMPDEPPINLRKSAAALAGTSEGTVAKYMKVARLGSPRLVKQMLDGEIKIGTAHRQLTVRTVDTWYVNTEDGFLKDPDRYIGFMYENINWIKNLYGFIYKQPWFCGGTPENMDIIHRLFVQYEKLKKSVGKGRRRG